MKPPKLTAEQAREIRQIVATRKAMPSNKALCRKYGICHASLKSLVAGHTYKWVR